MEKFSAIHGKKLRGFTDKAKRTLLAYTWQGNIRELQNVIERGVILAPNGSRIEVGQMFSSVSDDLPLEFGLDIYGGLDASNNIGSNNSEIAKELCDAVFNGAITLGQIEGILVETAVDKAQGNLSKAARLLGLTRRQLAYRLDQLQEKERPDTALSIANVKPVDHQI